MALALPRFDPVRSGFQVGIHSKRNQLVSRPSVPASVARVRECESPDVRLRGRGSILGRLAGIRIRIDNETINGRVYDFAASHQGDGVWRIDRVAVSTEPPPGTGTDTAPSFAAGSGPDNQRYTVGTAIDTVTLPAASGGNGTLSYTLSPEVPGLTFDATARQLSGTPTAAASYNMTYTATDEDGDTDTLIFSIAVEVTLVDVAQFLEARPRIAAAMLWSGVDNQPRPYAVWPQALKEKLDLAVRRQLNGDGSGLPDVMTNRTSGVLDDDDAATLTVLSKEDAEDLYVANVSHSLVLEMTGALPWSLEDLSEHELALLFSASPIGSGLQGSNKQGLRRGGFYDQYEDVAGVTGYIVHGRVLPAPPELVHEFLTQENLIGDSRHETIIRVIEWARYNLVHYCCGFSLGSIEEQWGYRGVPPLARMLFPTITTTTKYSDDAIRGYTAGCHGTNWFLMHLLRAVNIPVEYIRWAGHAIPSFPAEGLYLSHGDDPYSGLGQYLPPFPEPFPTSEIPISEATYQEWFSSSNSSEENLRNVGRRMTELAVENLPPALLEARCRDRANGATNESSEVYGPYSFGIPQYWTVAELEAMQFWERMDAKIEEYGGCSIFDS